MTLGQREPSGRAIGHRRPPQVVHVTGRRLSAGRRAAISRPDLRWPRVIKLDLWHYRKLHPCCDHCLTHVWKGHDNVHVFQSSSTFSLLLVQGDIAGGIWCDFRKFKYRRYRMARSKSSIFWGAVMDEIDFLWKCQLQPNFEPLAFHLFLDVFLGLFQKHQDYNNLPRAFWGEKLKKCISTSTHPLLGGELIWILSFKKVHSIQNNFDHFSCLHAQSMCHEIGIK